MTLAVGQCCATHERPGRGSGTAACSCSPYGSKGPKATTHLLCTPVRLAYWQGQACRSPPGPISDLHQRSSTRAGTCYPISLMFQKTYSHTLPDRKTLGRYRHDGCSVASFCGDWFKTLVLFRTKLCFLKNPAKNYLVESITYREQESELWSSHQPSSRLLRASPRKSNWMPRIYG